MPRTSQLPEEFQQWEPIILRTAATSLAQTAKANNKKKTGPLSASGNTGIESVHRNKNADVSAKNRKLDNDHDTLAHETVTHNFRVSLQKARIAKKMSQKDLAMALNERAASINDYESGKAIPNGAFIARLERVLGSKLPRK